jgi:hypothetical protein
MSQDGSLEAHLTAAVPGKNPAEFCSFMGGKTSDQGADV